MAFRKRGTSSVLNCCGGERLADVPWLNVASNSSPKRPAMIRSWSSARLPMLPRQSWAACRFGTDNTAEE
jgi:hypothetical protein